MRKLHIWLFGFYFVWLDDLQADYIIGKILYYLVKIITVLIVGILPYYFARFTWFRIMVYFVDKYHKFIPINLFDIQLDLDAHDIDVDLWDIYEVHQLDQ